MAKKSRGVGGMNGNVVNLFGNTTDGAIVAVDVPVEESAKAKELMLAALDHFKEDVAQGVVDGLILIGIRADQGEFGAESFIGGAGVWGRIHGAVGVIEVVKHDLIKEARQED